MSWHVSSYKTDEYFGMALIFISLFFITFYTTFLAFKLLQKEKFDITDILLVLANSFIFYGIGYGILDGHEIGAQLLGVFTLFNAAIHFIVSVMIYHQKLADKNLLYLIAGLVLVFITITIPVQLNGSWVTLLWVFEAALLFWIGRTKNNAIYEKISYSLMLLAFLSVLQDWGTAYNSYSFEASTVEIKPFFNIYFLSSMLFIGALVFI